MKQRISFLILLLCMRVCDATPRNMVYDMVNAIRRTDVNMVNMLIDNVDPNTIIATDIRMYFRSPGIPMTRDYVPVNLSIADFSAIVANYYRKYDPNSPHAPIAAEISDIINRKALETGPLKGPIL